MESLECQLCEQNKADFHIEILACSLDDRERKLWICKYCLADLEEKVKIRILKVL